MKKEKNKPAENEYELTYEQKEELLYNAIGFDKNFFENEKLITALSEVENFNDIHGSFNEMKEQYYRKEKNERFKYLELLCLEYASTYDRLDINNLLPYIQKNVQNITESKITTSLSDQFRIDFEKPIYNFCKTGKRLVKFWEIERNIIQEINSDYNRDLTVNLWKISDEQKTNIYNALSKEKIIKYSGNCKPIVSMKNVIFIFKALHELKLIDESLISYKPVSKKETWKPDFIIAEFIQEISRKDSNGFNDTNIRDGKRDFYTTVNNSDSIDNIKTIIQSALTL